MLWQKGKLYAAFMGNLICSTSNSARENLGMERDPADNQRADCTEHGLHHHISLQVTFNISDLLATVQLQ